MNCELRDELGIEYLLATDQVQDATRELDWAVTITQRECAATRRHRLEAHRLYIQQALADHCEQHGCANAEVDEMLPGRAPVAA